MVDTFVDAAQQAADGVKGAARRIRVLDIYVCLGSTIAEIGTSQ